MSNDPGAIGEEPTEERIEFVQNALIAWFQRFRRDLPWRTTRDPYRILVSEVMLQQTQVDRVLPHYHAFLERFPTVESLAEASTAEVITRWAGLGYNRRAVNLQRTARHVVEKLGGVFPASVSELRQLPGIGPYTAGAIACFAFEQDVAFIDTNIRRVIHRLFFGVDVPAPAATDRQILDLAARLVPAGNGWTWNQALMEFGAIQCTARRPACIICPLHTVCKAFPAVTTVLADLPKGARRKREEPFAGSSRFYRGRVIDALREQPASGLSITELGSRVRDDYSPEHAPWLYEVVRGLERDGLALVAEDPEAYDADSGKDDAPRVRVRLP